MKKIICPPFLNTLDKAIIISPSGSIDSQYIDSAYQVLQGWGLMVEIAPHARGQYGRYGGTIEERLSDLQEAVDDEDIKLIFCSRGGYGVVQLLDKLNLEGIKEHPKWIVGYSDITALHLALLQKGIVSLHAPMARHLSEDSNDTASCFLKETLFRGMPDYTITSHLLNREGIMEGKLFGGNLAVLSSLIGTPYVDVPENGILFIEDIGEAPYKIDRMMWQLKLSGILSRLSGLIVGQFTDCPEDTAMGSTIYESIRSTVDDYNYPVVFDFPVGHVKENYPLLHGGMAKIEVKEDKITMKWII
ncbi:muramoyltetrapeptide carboxypeptidase [Dysgonomonas alginatilytica]|uniref:Muramoyltetrapeptide carboxypeptidase n=1 Tax=Dysgonomonas alginatilytica TaxID=1605892 RepID=A0A2V3PSY8_9BACT|nr:LD-carboxypeptidase [Dysgonomonas alginatilytica]PXV68837.1 muramoyltetrapeptide carboxypeptidase [Dysgonomonas alginatilytica]